MVDAIGSQVAAATEAGVLARQIQRYRSGEQVPSFAVVAKLAAASGFDLNWVATGMGPQRKRGDLARIDEIARAARAKWGLYNSAHEGFAVLLEEVDELKAHVWTKQGQRDLESMRDEALDIAACALRFAAEVCDEKRGRR